MKYEYVNTERKNFNFVLENFLVKFDFLRKNSRNKKRKLQTKTSTWSREAKSQKKTTKLDV